MNRVSISARPPLITAVQYRQLLANGRQSKESGGNFDPLPVVKFFTPDADAVWLLTEIDPDAPDIAFGLCDLGLGFPELGNVSLTSLMELKGMLGLLVERDYHFHATKPISQYAEEAYRHRRIIT